MAKPLKMADDSWVAPPGKILCRFYLEDSNSSSRRKPLNALLRFLLTSNLKRVSRWVQQAPERNCRQLYGIAVLS